MSTAEMVVWRGKRAKLTASPVGMKADEGVVVVGAEVAVGSLSPVPVVSDMMAAAWSCRVKGVSVLGGE
jgi:hypothetical protein